MKKIIMMLLFVAGTLGFVNVNAQAKPMKKTSTMKMDSSSTKSSTKKDGTPDMRYKSNKMSSTKTVTTGPVKKNGTPDMRYKANKDSSKK